MGRPEPNSKARFAATAPAKEGGSVPLWKMAFVGLAVATAWRLSLPKRRSSSATSMRYRANTAWNAFQALNRLDDQEVQTFLNSFQLWDAPAFSTAADFHAGEPAAELVNKPADAQAVQDYYGVLNKLCALGNVEKMYIPPVMDGQLGVFANQLAYEEWFAGELQIHNESRVLELGCGRGRISHHVASRTGASVVAMNLEATQLDAARAFAAETAMLDKLEFLRADFNHVLPFADESFDAAYEVQALTRRKAYSTNLTAVLGEVSRVLKVGGTLSLLDGVMLDGFDGTNETQKRLLHETRQVTGLGGFWHYKYWHHALEESGFKILHARVEGGPQRAARVRWGENLARTAGENPEHTAEGAPRPSDATHGWYPLIDRERWLFEHAVPVVDALVRFKVLKPHFKTLLDRFTKHGDSFTAMDREGLLTTSYAVIAQKL
ncbi:S-adenosyl-L-methionine-dependent methyltransferase [Pelagophyceae sp. CCMP2097]|nr:S-adenosyl-L-methionine-dependent methyltransferase [Pelagophyceae sp. CCMP2097]